MPQDKEKLFTEWLESYKNLIFKVVNTYTSSAQDRDDLFQEILLQLWSSIPNFKGSAKETTWIYRVALNTALVWQRGEKRKNKKLLTEVSKVQQNEHRTDEQSEHQSVLEQVYISIRKLSKSESSILLLYLDGLNYDQMADVLGISKTNAGVRLNRAKKKLAQLMKGVIDDFR